MNKPLTVIAIKNLKPKDKEYVIPAGERPRASSSSMKMMQGAALRACWKRSRTRAAPTPTNISTKRRVIGCCLPMNW